MTAADAGTTPALFEFFERLPRQGPGATEITAALYARLRPRLPADPNVADMGCGSGAAGLVLADAGARVVGVDVHQPYLDAFGREAAARGLGERVATRCAGMLDSGLAPSSLDLVWSEGAVFTVGFDAALATFQRLLRPNGIVVLSECAWLQEHVPPAARDFWAAAYPAMRTTAGLLRAAETAGYRFLHAEVLPEWAWERDFFQPMERVIAEVEREGPDRLRAIAAEQCTEIDLVRRHGDVFGYVFLALMVPPS